MNRGVMPVIYCALIIVFYGYLGWYSVMQPDFVGRYRNFELIFSLRLFILTSYDSSSLYEYAVNSRYSLKAYVNGII